ncbi:hypothetical protein [Spirosoma validum]|uniref:Uncharacterized protein n=1 Tax=Spirosoma validum TaxID=2771355 RepID=A0A927B1S1_9BACT|nr:hypothetical protein [Spirosoma validum]MBD2753738.1 hypothetical protein [Spirosoma validum]
MNLESWQTFWQVLILLGAIAVAVGGFGTWKVDKMLSSEKEQKESTEKVLTQKQQARTGILASSRKVLFSIDQKVYPTIEIGDSGTNFELLPTAEYFFNVEDSKLIINKNNDSLFVSMKFYTPSGDLLAEIVDNEWTLNKEGVLDRNYTKNALEVRGSNGEIELQIQLLPDRVRLQGIFRGPNGGLSLALVKHPIHGKGAKIIVLQEGEKLIPENKIQPMFRYPSDTHLGELIEREN